MSIATCLRQIQRRARWRRLRIDLLRWLPWVMAATSVAQRGFGLTAALTLAALASALLAARLVQRWRALDRRWLIQALDRQDRRLEDSGELLFAPTATLGPLPRLQQNRIAQRVLSAPPDLRETLPPTLRPGALAALLLALVVTGWPQPAVTTAATEPLTVRRAEPAARQSLQASLLISPPPYTGLPDRSLDRLDAEVAEGSRLRWTLQFAIKPQGVRLRFVDGEHVALQEVDGRWTAERQLESSTLYRIELDAAPALAETAAHRIDVRPDQPPQIDVQQPERTLTVLDAAARHWALGFDASDDVGLGSAQLLLTLAQGSGEQVSVSERRIALRGSGGDRQQRFDHRINLAALGFAPGDDLIARLEVRDRRPPTPNVSRSPSFILRWPAAQGSDGSGVEGLIQQTLPAYFRSQRQVIMDTEALIAERPQIDPDARLSQSDLIGVDQRILRLRYGQFLGEEAEDAEAGHEHDEHDEAPAASAFGDAGNLIAEVGHLHDIPEAATLLDPATRELLRAALRAMWQAELHLRSGEPGAALPFEYRALDYIKRVQQADRIYLARVGLELPQLDPARRLTGAPPRAGRRPDPLNAPPAAAAPLRSWRALQQGELAPLDDLQRWLRDAGDDVSDPLALLAEIDALRRDPDCADCRGRLADQLWSLLTAPAVMPALRPQPDPAGRAYLDAMTPAGATP